MKKLNKNVLTAFSVLATPFVVENIVETKQASAAEYTLTTNVNAYGTADNASKKTNSKKTYTQGTYHIYKEYKGMINITKTPGRAGAWINPLENKIVDKVTEEKVQTPKVKTVDSKPAGNTTLVAKEVTKEVVKETASKPAAAPQTETITPKPVASAGEYLVNNKINTYTTAGAAASKTNVKSSYQAGTYYIFKEYKGMLNITRTKGRAGAWINPLENIVAPKVDLVKAEAPKVEKTENKADKVDKVETTPILNATPTQVKEATKVEEKKVETKPQKFEAGQVYELTAKTGVYTNSADASSKSGASRDYDKGQYYIYKVHNGMINISRTKGKAGAWLNPSEIGKLALDLDVLPFANKNFTITSPYAAARSISSIGIRDVHNGVDFATTNSKEEILATEAGKVVGAGLSPYGDGAQYVTIKHSENSYTSYWHLANNSIMVKAGQEVKAGQKIGVIGSTGWSTGIHLHFMHATTSDIFKSHQDPIKYLKSLKK